jgi:hypothetical protein
MEPEGEERRGEERRGEESRPRSSTSEVRCEAYNLTL